MLLPTFYYLSNQQVLTQDVHPYEKHAAVELYYPEYVGDHINIHHHTCKVEHLLCIIIVFCVSNIQHTLVSFFGN